MVKHGLDLTSVTSMAWHLSLLLAFIISMNYFGKFWWPNMQPSSKVQYPVTTYTSYLKYIIYVFVYTILYNIYVCILYIMYTLYTSVNIRLSITQF